MAVCIFCEGRGKVERYVHALRRLAMVRCKRCQGTGHQVEVVAR